jgi:hypothetical protein
MEGLLTNLDVFVVLKQSGSVKNRNSTMYNLIKSKLVTVLSDDQDKRLKKFCSNYCCNLQTKWENSGSKGSAFLKKYADWLEANVVWPDFTISSASGTVNLEIDEMPGPSSTVVSPLKSIGTSTTISPRKPFTELGPKQKKKRVENMTSNLSIEELSYSYISTLKTQDKYADLAFILDHLLKNPDKVNSVKDFILTSKSQVMSSEKALGIMMSLKLSKWQYNTLRKTVQNEHIDIFPSYYATQKAKQECYPPENEMEITDISAQIKLQAILNLTTQRLLKNIEIETDYKNLELISKWGFDGASNQSNYKQRSESNLDDSSIFMGSLVPIKLICGDNILWENKCPNSTFFCRPLFFMFMAETKANVMNEMTRIESEINNLNKTVLNGKSVSHTLHLTMIDGKITSILSGTATQSCDICKATPKDMNNLEILAQKSPNTEIYKYGISSLHAWIRFMECILHISYRLEFKSWIAKGENSDKLNKKKQDVQEAFKNRNGLLIDVVKQGYGTTNDGNTARRFFADVETTASITGVDENLIRRFSIILEAISSGIPINVDKFKIFTDETIVLYIQLYKWYYMPASVHKILVHGKDIIANFGVLPIGTLTEEASESRNKDFRKYRENHSRKFCRRATNQDILNNLLISSDPYISQIRPKIDRKHRMISKDAQNLLLREISDNNKENFAFVDVDTLSDSEN